MLVWLNGTYVEGDAATVSVFDAGLQHGVGLFETMAARNGRVFRVDAHVQRLIDSARELLLTDSLRADPLAQAVEQTVERSGLEATRVRLTVTGGTPGLPGLPGPPGLSGLPHRQEPRKVDPTILIVAQPPTDYPEAFFTSGVTVVVADGRANPLDPMAGHKTLNYWHRIQALQQAAARKTGEALWFTVSNHLAGGSVSNAFLVKDGALVTPIARGEEASGAIRAPVLPGITRAAIMELARGQGVGVTTRMLDIGDVLSADEVFLTNSSWGVLPVVGVEREKIGQGQVGEITRRLRQAWLELVERETSA